MYRVQYLESVCTVSAPFALEEEWGRFTGPFFQMRDRLTDVSGRVHVRVEPAWDSDALAEQSGEEIVLHGPMPGRLLEESEQELRVRVPELRAEYHLRREAERTVLTYRCAEWAEENSLDLLRLVRGLLIGMEEAQGRSKLHMSVAVGADGATAFLGGEGAGKTSFLLASLKQMEGWSFLTNDKALVKREREPNGAGSVLTAVGMPFAVSIGRGSLSSCEELSVTPERRVIGGEAYFWPLELADALGCGICVQAPLTKLVSVQIQPLAEEVAVSVIEEEAEKRALLEAHVLQFSDKMTPHWLLERLGMTAPPAEELVEALLALPFYRITGNPWHGNLRKAAGILQAIEGCRG